MAQKSLGPPHPTDPAPTTAPGITAFYPSLAQGGGPLFWFFSWQPPSFRKGLTIAAGKGGPEISLSANHCPGHYRLRLKTKMNERYCWLHKKALAWNRSESGGSCKIDSKTYLHVSWPKWRGIMGLLNHQRFAEKEKWKGACQGSGSRKWEALEHQTIGNGETLWMIKRHTARAAQPLHRRSTLVPGHLGKKVCGVKELVRKKTWLCEIDFEQATTAIHEHWTAHGAVKRWG